MKDVSGSGVKLISVTIVTPISFEGVVGFFWGGGGVGGGNVAGGGVGGGGGMGIGVGRGFF